MFFYNRVPFWLYTLVVLVLIPLAIYEYKTKTKKEYPNHPLKYVIVPAITFLITSCFKKLSQEVELGEIWTKVINISMITTGVLTVLSFIFMYYLLIKHNYFTPEALDKLKRTFIPLLVLIIFFAVCLLILWPYATS